MHSRRTWSRRGMGELVERWRVLREKRDPVDARRGAGKLGFALIRKPPLTWSAWVPVESPVRRYDA
ncbi:hypothetical protein ACWGKQ_10400 [Streptomyces sp. NPDC054770]